MKETQSAKTYRYAGGRIKTALQIFYKPFTHHYKYSCYFMHMIRSIPLFLIISTFHVGPSLASGILSPGNSGMFVLKEGKISFESTPEWKKGTIASASTYKELYPLKIMRLDQGRGLMLVGGLLEHLTGGRVLEHVPPCHGGRASIGSFIFLGAGDVLPKLAGVVDASGAFSVLIPPELIGRNIYLYFGGHIGGSFQIGLDSYTVRSAIKLPLENIREADAPSNGG